MNRQRNQLYYSDNLQILRSYIDTESVDLIYLDPSFNSNATYERKKALDRGVDGRIDFLDDDSRSAKWILIQAKSGAVDRGDIATLRGDMENQGASIAVLVTLKPPTRGMVKEANDSGFFEQPKSPEACPSHPNTTSQGDL